MDGGAREWNRVMFEEERGIRSLWEVRRVSIVETRVVTRGVGQREKWGGTGVFGGACCCCC